MADYRQFEGGGNIHRARRTRVGFGNTMPALLGPPDPYTPVDTIYEYPGWWTMATLI